jgi:hypothetical protein
MKRLLTVLFIAVLADTAACGGGGNSGGPSMPTEVQSLKSAPTPAQPYNIAATQLTAMYQGVTYTAVYSETPDNGTSMFNGHQATRSTITITVSANGAPVATQTSTAYFLENPFSPLGLMETVNGTTYDLIFTTVNPLPSTLSVGDSGTLLTGTFYVAGNPATVGMLTESWSVAANDSSTVLFIVASTGTLNGTSVSDTVTYSVDAQGNIAIVSVTVTLPGGGTITFS